MSRLHESRTQAHTSTRTQAHMRACSFLPAKAAAAKGSLAPPSRLCQPVRFPRGGAQPARFGARPPPTPHGFPGELRKRVVGGPRVHAHRHSPECAHDPLCVAKRVTHGATYFRVGVSVALFKPTNGTRKLSFALRAFLTPYIRPPHAPAPPHTHL